MTIKAGALALPLALMTAAAPARALAQTTLADTCPPPLERRVDASPRRVVRITLYNNSPIQPADVDRLITVANTIWMQYGVTIERGGGPGAVAVILTDRASHLPGEYGPLVLGSTLFTQGHATPYITLSLTAAEELADGSSEGGISFTARPVHQRVDMLMRILGVAFAHEMAHYLLDTSRHSSAGLLQRGLSVHELSYPDLTYLKLTPEQQRLLPAAAPSPNCGGAPHSHD